MIKLSEEEVRKRLRKLHNYEKIKHPQLKERSDRLREENKVLKKELAKVPKLEKQVEKLQLELEELRAMKFGRKRRNLKIMAKTVFPRSTKKSEKRAPESYRRPIPASDQVTDRLRLEVELCVECGDPLSDKKDHIHYREDLKRAAELVAEAKRIVEVTIESGVCKNKSCSVYGKREFALAIPKHNVILGENLRQFVVYLTVMQGQSYTEVTQALQHQYGITISEGQIANILEGESRLLTPYYNFLVDHLEAESKSVGAHYDETTWKTQSRGDTVSEGNYCWIKIGVQSAHQLIWFGKSRGKGVAEALRGDKELSIGVSDDYGSYRHLFDHHQLCWAHPHRKLRDLASSGNLKGQPKKVCEQAFKLFAEVYKKSRKAREKIRRNDWSVEQRTKEKLKLEKRFESLLIPTNHDPEKLKTIRESLRKNKRKYFAFFLNPELPLDNNKAERAIRKVVLKRKKSFGCQSQKGADVLSILYSVVFSLSQENPDQNFFVLYAIAAEFEGQ